jgi:hypothetical protein
MNGSLADLWSTQHMHELDDQGRFMSPRVQSGRRVAARKLKHNMAEEQSMDRHVQGGPARQEPERLVIDCLGPVHFDKPCDGSALGGKGCKMGCMSALGNRYAGATPELARRSRRRVLPNTARLCIGMETMFRRPAFFPY